MAGRAGKEVEVASVSESFCEYFAARTRHAGRMAFRAGRVVISRGSSEEVVATVFDTTEHRVRLRIADGKLVVGCTCDQFEADRALCKHIWSALLAAEAEGFLTAPALPSGTEIRWDAEWRHQADLEQHQVGLGPSLAEPLSSGASRRRDERRHESWLDCIDLVRRATEVMVAPASAPQRAAVEIWYVLDIPATFKNEYLVLQVLERRKRPDGSWSQPVPRSPARILAELLPPPPDGWILRCLAGPQSEFMSYVHDIASDVRSHFLLDAGLRDVLVPWIVQTGRCFLRLERDGALVSATWDEGSAWEFRIEVCYDARRRGWVLKGRLVRGEQEMPLREPNLLLSGGLVFRGSTIARLHDHGVFPWMSLLRRQQEIFVPEEQGEALLEAVYSLPSVPPAEWPDDLRLERRECMPVPVVRIQHRAARTAEGRSRAHAFLGFDYEGVVVGAVDKRPLVANVRKRCCYPRQWEFELQTKLQLNQLGFRQGYSLQSTQGPGGTERFQISPRHVQRAIRHMLQLGWYVELAGHRVRTTGTLQLELVSSLDWFELRGAARFADQVVELPELLAALRRGQETITLKDGSKAFIPEEWRQQYGLLAAVSTLAGEAARFHRSQVGLLDALLAANQQVRVDEGFCRLRDELAHFQGIEPADPPESFQGKLRQYQREGLGWFYFLEKFRFGGCLADDMGLGKTVQVLALLEQRRLLRHAQVPSSDDSNPAPTGSSGKGTPRRKKAEAEAAGPTVPPSLVVVPKSLVFNWKGEIQKFAPALQVLDHTGIDRIRATDHFQQYDVVLTTYGTLRRDILLFKDVEFDYVILDEAQAIKNSDSDTAKAVRLLKARHRLALSGTPIENHLGELWSLFEFLNPGMLGTARVFRDRVGTGKVLDQESRDLLARALRPFILRRTKQQVAKDLPERVEQTLLCEMSPVQRRLYDELRDHYRASLLGRVREFGIKKSTMHVLEALLRLRQAACHHGLLDKKYRQEESGKLELLLEHLSAVLEEGHKALVFSQFTSLLELVRPHLDQRGVVYEYLDGRTKDRQARVERFQNDPDCRLFLVSLKAGGVGLNLTAAEYVYLLDPWWNPAVEAQAIDRAHRIGQTRQVFAYRLIAKDSVEEKILQLQQWKRNLAESIIRSENSFISGLTAEDLELLLS
jgi:superfamily II DNA or RNA helicase